MHDDLMGWLHSSAGLSHAELVARFDPLSQQMLERLIRECLVNQNPLENLSADEFALWVSDLRSSEREWNRALGEVLLQAEEARCSGDHGGAIRLLKTFASECSWVPLRQIADAEAERS